MVASPGRCVVAPHCGCTVCFLYFTDIFAGPYWTFTLLSAEVSVQISGLLFCVELSALYLF